MKPFSYKRIIAYIFDIILVTIMATVLTFFLPENKKYESSLEEYTSLLNHATSEKITQEEFVKESNDVVYNINKNSITVTIVTTVLTISYFVVLTYFMNGQTLGKKLMNLKIVSTSKKKLTMNNYLVRGLIINSILMNVLGIIFILGLNKQTYLKVNDITTYIFGLTYIVTFGMILFREDKRGLHDYLAGTKVISVKDYVEDDDLEKEIIPNEDPKLIDTSIIGKNQIKM